MGVDHRVEQLADRAEGFVKKDGKKYESLVPLPEVISACMGYSAASKKVQGCFEQMIQTWAQNSTFREMYRQKILDFVQENGLRKELKM